MDKYTSLAQQGQRHSSEHGVLLCV